MIASLAALLSGLDWLEPSLTYVHYDWYVGYDYHSYKLWWSALKVSVAGSVAAVKGGMDGFGQPVRERNELTCIDDSELTVDA